MRIVDTSSRTREDDMSVSQAPGARVAGVGVKLTGPYQQEGGQLEDCLDALRHLICDKLLPGPG